SVFGSDWVDFERSTVLSRDPANKNRGFIPLLLLECQIPDALRRYKHIDFRDESESAFQELVNACRDPEKWPVLPSTSEDGVRGFGVNLQAADEQRLNGIHPNRRFLFEAIRVSLRSGASGELHLTTPSDEMFPESSATAQRSFARVQNNVAKWLLS